MVLIATWSVPDPANGVLLNYTITSNDSISETLPAPTVTVTVAGLQPYTMYSCSVVAMTIGCVGDAPILLKKGLWKMVRIVKVMGY